MQNGLKPRRVAGLEESAREARAAQEAEVMDLEQFSAALLTYKRLRQAAYRYVHRTLAKEVAITKRQVADRMRERFPDCPDDDVELAVNDVFHSFENPGRSRGGRRIKARTTQGLT